MWDPTPVHFLQLERAGDRIRSGASGLGTSLNRRETLGSQDGLGMMI